MKTRFFYAPECYNTWPKLFVLSEDGKFYCEYLHYMKPTIIELKFDFNSFKAEDYKWDNYQKLVEIDERDAKSKTLTRQQNWINRYLSNL